MSVLTRRVWLSRFIAEGAHMLPNLSSLEFFLPLAGESDTNYSQYSTSTGYSMIKSEIKAKELV